MSFSFFVFLMNLSIGKTISSYSQVAETVALLFSIFYTDTGREGQSEYTVLKRSLDVLQLSLVQKERKTKEPLIGDVDLAVRRTIIVARFIFEQSRPSSWLGGENCCACRSVQSPSDQALRTVDFIM